MINAIKCLMFCVYFLQVDLKLMCDNAMIYNKPDTIYHKAARKLLHSGMKVLSQVWKQRFTVLLNTSVLWMWVTSKTTSKIQKAKWLLICKYPN